MKLAIHLCVFTLLLSACNSQRPVRYVMDKDFVGKVHVTYNQPEAPVLEVRDRYTIARIPANGLLSTSSRMAPTWDFTQFFYQGANGELIELLATGDSNRRIWDQSKHSDPKEESERFFVGTQDQFSKTLQTPPGLGAAAISKPTDDILPELPGAKVNQRLAPPAANPESGSAIYDPGTAKKEPAAEPVAPSK